MVINNWGCARLLRLSPTGPVQTALTILAATTMSAFYAALFFISIAVLWGWYFIGLFSWAVFAARVIDQRSYFRRSLRRPPYSTRGLRLFVLYVLALFAVSTAVNIVFAATYLFGIYRPLFGPIPF
jgi:hypothetical protein